MDRALTTYRDEYLRRCGEGSDIVDHLPTLFDTVCRYPGARVVELGVRSGNSTAALLAAADEVDGHVWSVDIEWPHVPEWWTGNGRWTLVVGDDLTVAHSMPDEIDVLMIDTSHYYGHTLDELRAYVPRVVPGGTVLCHDTELASPYGAPWDDPPFPVARALDDYCAESGLSWRNITGCNGLGVLEVPA